MPKKPLSPERKISAQVKRLSLTLTQLKKAIDDQGGSLSLSVPLKRKGDFVRLIIRCRRLDVPEAWAMALLHHNVRIDGIDFHVKDYTASDGTRRLGWHRDLWKAGIMFQGFVFILLDLKHWISS